MTRRISMIAPACLLPAMILLLSSCSWSFSPQKSDLKMAAQAAKVAGVDDSASRNAPIILGPRPAKGLKGPAQPTVAAAPKPVTAKPAAPVASTTQAAVKTANSKAAPVQVAQKTPAAAAIASTPTPTTVAVAAAIPQKTPSAVALDKATMPLRAVPTLPTATMPSSDVLLTKVPTVGTAIHLASYREIGAAERGWTILRHDYKELAPLRPLYVAVDLPGKGHVLRLYGTGVDASGLKNICHDMQSEGAYCTANIAF